jgi:hypothetical protein
MSLAVSLSLFFGCKPQRPGNTVPDQSENVSSEEAGILTQLTVELRQTMRKNPKLSSGNFEDFAAARSDLVIPPPPPGKKYAISEKWKVVVVDR